MTDPAKPGPTVGAISDQSLPATDEQNPSSRIAKLEKALTEIAGLPRQGREGFDPAGRGYDIALDRIQPIAREALHSPLRGDEP
jgi:hypothetical protein